MMVENGKTYDDGWMDGYAQSLIWAMQDAARKLVCADCGARGETLVYMTTPSEARTDYHFHKWTLAEGAGG